jgi:sn-glycerol 3-phosphate transport system substrate-binding protein
MEQFSAIHDVPVATRANGYQGLDAELTINRTPFVQHMERQFRWYRDGLVKYDPDFAARRDMFTTGTCAIFFDSIAGYTGTQAPAEKNGIAWTVAELPHNAAATPINNLVGGAALWTLKGFSDAEYAAVGKFYAFIAQPEQQKLWSHGTGYFPVTIRAYEELVAEGYYERPENRNRDLAVKSLTRATPTELSKGIRLGNYVEIRNIITQELQKALSGEQTVQQALDVAVQRGNALLRRFETAFPGRTLP